MAKQVEKRNKTETKITVKIPDYITGADKAEVGNRVIDFIRERTFDGNNVNGTKWQGKAGKYTKEYADEKGYSSPVDLELSGKMLAAMRQFKGKNKPGDLIIGYTKGSEQERKAEGNIRGTYGQKSPIAGKARPFLDILGTDVAKIVLDYTAERAKKSRKKPVKGKPLKQDIKKPGFFTFG